MAKKAVVEQDEKVPEKQARITVDFDSINFEEAASALKSLKPAGHAANNRTSIVRRLLPAIEEAKNRGVKVEAIAELLSEQTNVPFTTNTLRGILANLNRKNKPRTEE